MDHPKAGCIHSQSAVSLPFRQPLHLVQFSSLIALKIPEKGQLALSAQDTNMFGFYLGTPVAFSK